MTSSIDEGGFCARFLMLLSELKLSQNEFARRLGSTSAFVSNMARGKSKPGLEFLERIASTFGVSLDWLVLGRGNIWGEPSLLQIEWFQAVWLRYSLAELAAAGNADAQMLIQELTGDLPGTNSTPTGLLNELQTRAAQSGLIARLYNDHLHSADPLQRNKDVLLDAIRLLQLNQQDPLVSLLAQGRKPSC
jgi:transcriptional regulator with XRE-family HTH domain